jgi:hypothetical protein
MQFKYSCINLKESQPRDINSNKEGIDSKWFTKKKELWEKALASHQGFNEGCLSYLHTLDAIMSPVYFNFINIKILILPWTIVSNYNCFGTCIKD